MTIGQGYNVGTSRSIYQHGHPHINPLTGGWTDGASWVKRLIIINLAIWFVMVISFRIWPGVDDGSQIPPGSAMEWWFRYIALTPGYVLRGEIWQIVTSMFMHSPQPTHVIFNLLILYIFGPRVERDKGSAWFIKFYLLCGIVGNLLSIVGHVVSGMTWVPGVGASGAILGILAAFCLIYSWQFFWIFWMVPIRVIYILFFYLALEAAWILAPVQDCTDHFAHFGGMAAAWIFLKTPWFRVGSVTRVKQGPPKPPRTVKRKGKPPATGGGAKDFLEV